MVDYCTLAEVKAQIATRSNSTVDDSWLAEIITDVSREIDDHCQRHFYASYETRYFDAAYPAVYGHKLYLDEDLVGVTTITNGDGTTVAASEYVLLPANETPKYAIKLKTSVSTQWTYTTDYEQAIAVEGTWGYNDGTVPPDVVQRAAIRLAAWRYSQRDAPFNARGFPQTGMVEVPTAMPEDVERMLKSFRRLEIGVVGTVR